MWTMTIPVLSTEHLKPETRVWLTTTEDILCAHCEEILFVFIPDDPPNMPVDLVTVFDWVREAGYAWVRFDEAGDYIPDLPKYEWR